MRAVTAAVRAPAENLLLMIDELITACDCQLQWMQTRMASLISAC